MSSHHSNKQMFPFVKQLRQKLNDVKTLHFTYNLKCQATFCKKIGKQINQFNLNTGNKYIENEQTYFVIEKHGEVE